MHDKHHVYHQCTYFWIFCEGKTKKVFVTVGFYLNCGVTLTWCMFSIFSMSSPEHTNTLHCLQLRLILDGGSFIIPFCCFFFIFTFSSIMACIWNSLIYTKPNNVSFKSTWGILECIFEVDSHFFLVVGSIHLAHFGDGFAHHFLPVFVNTLSLCHPRSCLRHQCVTTVLCSSSTTGLRRGKNFLPLHHVDHNRFFSMRIQPQQQVSDGFICQVSSDRLIY